MALFGNGGFFDEFISSFKKDPLANLATGGLLGVTKGIKKNPQDLLLPGFEDTAKLTGNLAAKGVDAFSEGFGVSGPQNDGIQSELAVKDDLRRESDLIRARQNRAKAGSLISSSNTIPSLLG